MKQWNKAYLLLFTILHFIFSSNVFSQTKSKHGVIYVKRPLEGFYDACAKNRTTTCNDTILLEIEVGAFTAESKGGTQKRVTRKYYPYKSDEKCPNPPLDVIRCYVRAFKGVDKFSDTSKVDVKVIRVFNKKSAKEELLDFRFYLNAFK